MNRAKKGVDARFSALKNTDNAHRRDESRIYAKMRTSPGSQRMPWKAHKRQAILYVCKTHPFPPSLSTTHPSSDAASAILLRKHPNYTFMPRQKMLLTAS